MKHARSTIFILLAIALIVDLYFLLRATPKHRNEFLESDTTALMDSVLAITDTFFDQWVTKPTDQGWKRWKQEYLLPGLKILNRELANEAREPFPRTPKPTTDQTFPGVAWGKDDPFYR